MPGTNALAYSAAAEVAGKNVSLRFVQKLAEGLPTTSPYKCPQCNFQSKTQLALVRHVGAKHRLIKKLLQVSMLLNFSFFVADDEA